MKFQLSVEAMEPSCDLASQLPPETSCTPEAMPEYAKLNKADSVHAQSLPLPAPLACPSEACRWGRQCRRDAEVSLSSGHPTSASTRSVFQTTKEITVTIEEQYSNNNGNDSDNCSNSQRTCALF